MRWKVDHRDRVHIAKAAFQLAEARVRAFRDHTIDPVVTQHFKDVYGGLDPIHLLLDVMHFPPHSDMVDRTRYASQIRDLILEHEQYGSDGNYMPRSVILGWIAQQHDLILRDLDEAA